MHPLEKFRYCPSCGSSRFEENSEKSKICKSCGFEYFLNPSSANVAFIINAKGELLVERRKENPGKGTLDLPGGFSDISETAEEGVRREVKEETGLTVTNCQYLFSQPNVYRYSGFDVHTLDLFFRWTMPQNVSGLLPKTSTPSNSDFAPFAKAFTSFLNVWRQRRPRVKASL